jgi:hypothetical protein
VEVRSGLSIMAETVFFSSPLADSGRVDVSKKA